MRVLTVRQPWAMAITTLGKDVENRSRNIAGSYRGPVAIQAAAQRLPIEPHLAAGRAIRDITGYMPLFTLQAGLGAILGVVDLVDVHEPADLNPDDGPARACSPWAQDGAWHLILANPRTLPAPIPWKGALGLRTLPDDVEQQILAALAGAPS